MSNVIKFRKRPSQVELEQFAEAIKPYFEKEYDGNPANVDTALSRAFIKMQTALTKQVAVIQKRIEANQ